MSKAQHRRAARRAVTRHRLLGILGLAAGAAGMAAVVVTVKPLPDVSAAGSNALLQLNRWLVSAGDTFLAVLAGTTLVGLVAYFASPKMREIVRLTAAPPEARGVARYLLPPLLIATVAMGVSLGDEAGRGAGEPIKQLLTQAGADPQHVSVLLPNKDTLPFNYAAIPRELLAEAPATAVPIRLHLGSASNPELSVNPSSAAIITVPDAMWKTIGGRVTDTSVATTAQFAHVGDTVRVEDHPLVVERTVDWYPGLDRTAAVLPERAYAEVAHATDPYSAVLLLDSNASRWAESASHDPFAVMSLTTWLDRYDSFWRRSVSPLSMEYLLCLLIVGAVASGFIRSSDILRRRRQLAVQHILGVSKRTLIAAEYVRAVLDTAVATLLAAPLAIALIAITNSSQYGVAVVVKPAVIGAGALLLGCSMILSVSSAAGMLWRMDAVNEVR